MTGVARPDGAAFKGRDRAALEPVLENEQIAAIHHRDGGQRMILKIRFDAAMDERAVWIVPLPDGGDGVKLDIVDRFPVFAGTDPRRDAESAINRWMMVVRMSQVWAVLIEAIAIPSLLRGRNVEVEDRMDKWGIRAEIVRAGNVGDLSDYLWKQDVDIEETALRHFEPYLNNRHALALVRIASRQEAEKEFGTPNLIRDLHDRQPCLSVEFRTPEAFFPLRPTSLYGDAEIPVRLYIVGYVKPVTTAHLSLDVRHYRAAAPADGRRRRGDPEPENRPQAFFPGLSDGPLPYTLVEGNQVAKQFTDDLRFTPVDPPGMAYGEFVADRLGIGWALVVVSLVLWTLLSYVSGGIAGAVMYRRWRGFAAFGFWNLLTLVALVFRIRHEPGELGEKLRGDVRVLSGALVLRYSHLFTVTYVLLTVLLQWLFHMPLS